MFIQSKVLNVKVKNYKMEYDCNILFKQANSNTFSKSSHQKLEKLERDKNKERILKGLNKEK